MAKKDGKRKAPGSGSGYQPATLREESTGRKEIKGCKNVNTMLRWQHLQRLATWAGGEASVHPLAALFGYNLASGAEATGFHPDAAVFPCQRGLLASRKVVRIIPSFFDWCETILQPGYNCTVRIEKSKAKVQGYKKSCTPRQNVVVHKSNVKAKEQGNKKSRTPTQNVVVYNCNFCLERNLRKGTPRGHLQDILPSRSKHIPVREQNKSRGDIISPRPKSSTIGDIRTEMSPVTPVQKTCILLSQEKRKSGLGSNKAARGENGSAIAETAKGTGGSSKRRRKGWSSLKEIVENREREQTQSIGNLTIPFLL